MTEYRDWDISIAFTVSPGDVEGIVTEALFEAAVEHLPTDAEGLVVRADAVKGKVWIVFTLVNSSRQLAGSVASQMRDRICDTALSGDAALSSDAACITAA